MKTLISRLTLALALGVLGWTGTAAQAADTDADIGRALLRATTFDSERGLQMLREMEELRLRREAAGGYTAAAPPLSYLQIYAVISSQYPAYEYLSASQTSTVQDHGGAQMDVVTVELGYGASWWASMNSSQVSKYQTQTIVDSSNVVIGFYHWWIADGHASGTFYYQNISQNSPFNLMSDSVYIQ